MYNSRLLHIFIFKCLILSSHCANNKVSMDKKIIIIGAGPAGIAAASKLFESGFNNVKILEAENRIGGRVYTTKLGNYSVDLGAQCVHGEKDNVAFNLAYPLGLLATTNQTVVHEKLFDSAGNVVGDKTDQLLDNFIRQYFVEGVSDENLTTSVDSYAEFIEQAYNKEYQNVTEMMSRKSEILHFLELILLSNESADSWNDVSVIDTDGYIIREGDQDVNWKTKGYGLILDILMKRYPDPEKELPVLNNTILNAEVVSIDYTGNENEYPIIITTKDNRIFEADHVIVTVSLGVLKAQHKSLFNPPLPAKKIDVIETLGFGNAGKVYLLFEKPFWHQENAIQFGFLWNDADRKVIESDPEKIWTLGVAGAQTVEYKPNLLEFYISSKGAKAMELIPENKVYSHTLELLERFMGKIFDIPKPIAMMRTQWYANPHFRGTYSYRNVESEKRNIHPRMLQESITSENPRVLFAGEATSPHRFSTVDGAIESGWTAAESIIKLYKAQCKRPLATV